MKRISIENLAFVLISLCLVAYTFIRAAMISISHDEVGTYLGYSINPVMDIIRFTNLQLNNHVLNSLLVKLSISLFGVSEFTIRLPNLIAFIVYLIFSWKIISLLTKDKILMITGFILMNFNPYLLDFFSIARGYGLEISFMILSLFFLMKFQLKNKAVYVWTAVFFSALGVLSNFTFITVYFSTIILINLLLILALAKEKAALKFSVLSFLKFNLPVIIITSVLAAIVAGPVIRLHAIGEFSAQGKANGLWESLFRSVIRHSLYGHSSGNILSVVFQVLSLLLILLFAFKIYKGKWIIIRSGFFLLMGLLISICLWFFLQHILLGSMYPQQRFALFMFPLYMLTLIAAIGIIITSIKSVAMIRSVMAIITVFVLINFYNAANVSYYFDWKYNLDTRQMLEDNLKDMKNLSVEKDRQIVLAAYWLYYPTLKYYLMDKKIDWISLESYRESFLKQADFYYIPVEYKDSLNKFNPIILKDYPGSGTVLYR